MQIKKYPLFFISVLLYQFAVGQCSYNLPDSLCPIENIKIIGTGKISVDLCSNRLDSLVVIENSPVAATEQFKIIKEGNRYFLFHPDLGAIYVYRIELNSDLNSVVGSPAPLIASNDPFATNLAFEMVKVDSIKWVAFKADYAQNYLGKISFDSITQSNNLQFDSVGVFGITGANYMKVFGNYLFITNSNNTISKIHFDNLFQNVIDSAVITGGFSGPVGIDIIYDCNNSEYYGYVANNNNGTVSRLDFGSSLSNNTPATSIISNSVAGVRGLKMYYQQDAWYCFLNFVGASRLELLKLGAPNNPAPIVALDTTNAIMDPNYAFCIETLIDSSRLHVFSSYVMSHFVFKGNCNTPYTWLSSIDSINFNYQPTDTGQQFIEITLTDTNHTTYNTYDSLHVVITPPMAFFSTSGTCEGEPVNFMDKSDICYGTIVSWSWTFGDSNSSTIKNPSHTYTNGGTYTVTLTVQSSNNDSSIYVKNITVVPLPIANFTPSAFTECSTYLMQFTDNSTAANDSIISWLWHFGNQDSTILQSPSYVYTTSGNYNVQLIVTNSNGCVDSISKAINILPSPLAQFSLTSTCIGAMVLFTNLTDSATNSAVNYVWDFGTTDTSHATDVGYTYAAIDSSYIVQLTATAANGCSTTYPENVTIGQPALVSFTQSADTVCKNVPVLFINTSTTQNNDTIILKHWLFSDGYTIDNVDTVTHAFTTSSIAYAILTIVTATYCDSSVLSYVVVLENPVADFTFNNSCLQDSNLLVSTSLPAPGDNIFSYNWNFGDSTAIVNATSTYHAYDTAGIYNATLTVLSAKGCSDSITKAVSVYDLPIANFLTSLVLCTDSLTQFNDFTYTYLNDSVKFWNWNFGNAATSTNQNPFNNYSQPGNYNVQLIVESQKGCRDTIAKSINVKLSPSPSFNFDLICHGDFTNFNFIDLSPTTGSISAWSWDFGELGSGNSTLQNPAHQYILPATYNVTVTATDTNQCFKSANQSVVIHSNPDIGFITTNPCEQTATIFTDTSMVIGDTITQWQWVINSDTVSTASSANYVFSTPGSYLVQLTATSNAGCNATAVNGVNIYANPIASFNTIPAYASPNQIVVFNNTSQNALTYFWTFGDGFTSTLLSPPHAYVDTNVYQVTLVATSDRGCSDTAYANYNVLIPHLEIAVTDVGFQLQNNLLTLSVKLVNLGNINIDNYNVVANIDEVPSLVEFSTLPITVASPTVVYTFKSKIAITDNFNPGYFCIEVQNPNGKNDADLTNNKLCKSIQSTFELLSIVPNPTESDLEMYVNSPFDQTISVEIYDDLAQLVYKADRGIIKGFNNLELSTNQLRKGYYILRLSNESVQLKSSFIKK